MNAAVKGWSFRDQQGAVYVEFLIAFLPLFLMFLCVAQLADLYATQFVVKHAAYRAARAGAVVFPDNPRHYEAVSKAEEVRAAAYAILAAKRTITSAEIQFPHGERYERGQAVEVVVRAQARCIFPLASRVMCGMSSANPTRALEGRAALPAQSARYEYSE